VVVVLRI
jgi:chaperonin GroEL